jgi:exonuclease SbcC
MRLEKLHIHSFGALTEVSFAFAPGLNVILGPNEAGKSTLFEAIRHTLLTSSRLTKKQFQAALQRFLPAGGGDTVACTLVFSRAGRGYTLRRQWGSGAAAELQLPAGGRLSDEEAIAAALAEQLPAAEGTLRSVLMTSQAGLAATLQDLRADPGTLYSLSDLLHKALLETDGVSVARLQGLLERTALEYFEHWDREQGRPEGNRGPGNPYRKGVGRVLAAWYARENLRRLHREILEQEDAYSSASRSLEQRRLALGERERWLQENRRAAHDARERRRLEVECRDNRREEQAVKRDAEEWPALLERKKHLEAELPEISARLGVLDAEKRDARDFEQNRALRERLERAGEKKRQLQEAEAALAACAPLPREELAKLRGLSARREQLAAGLAAGRIQAVLRAKTDLDLTAEVDLEEPEARRVPASGEASFEAGGRIFIDHADWSLELVSGTADLRDKTREYRQAEEELRGLLKERGMASLGEAERHCAAYEAGQVRVENARANLMTELAGDSLADLERAAASAAAGAARRPLADILEEHVAAAHREERIREQLREVETGLAGLGEAYGGREAMWEKLGGLAARTRELEKNLAALASLPEGFADAPAFVAAYEEAAAAAEQDRKAVQEQEIACARLEEKMPEESSEEVALRLREAERAFDTLLAKGEAVDRIRAAAADLVTESGRLGGEKYGDLLAGYIRETTGGAYRGMQMEELLPAGLVRESGLVLPAGLLSAGTMDTLALALRLAMAELFLAGREGFLVLDDPLVDLDPQRQQQAAAAIVRFAADKQLLLFTCHPGQAELFGEAHRLELPRLQS